VRTLLALLTLVVVAGCGGSVEVGSKPDKLEGATIAKKANVQLEKQNPQLEHGQLTCGDVTYEKGKTTRCLRTVDIGEGRRVKIGATVTITDTKKGGHYGIVVDKQAAEFGQTGDSIEKDLAAQYAKQFRTGTPDVTCPDYLAGKVGASVTCSLKADDGAIDIDVTVDRVVPKNFETVYSFKQK
jgi:hypothetical protein